MSWLDALPQRFHAALARCARGDAPANVAVMQLQAEAMRAGEVESVLAAATAACREGAPADAARLHAALVLAHANPQAFATVRGVLEGAEHGVNAPTPEAGVARWAQVFDAAVRRSPEGSVALYALGDSALLQAATDEVVALLRRERLLGLDRDVLDVGCGIGRFEVALAPAVRSIFGIDVSSEMIEAARCRCCGAANVTLLATTGRDLSPFADASFDLVLAVDAFPYLVQSGAALAATHVREAARVLRRGGRFVLFNFSYRGDDDLDRADVAGLAREAALDIVRNGERELALWDALVFELAR
ncbi:MAG: class I SAM-dependent methyltransferase [Rhizobacter sp.]|nr:class I SAM-dependent methyltransferase [Rhizobacter sp.]